MKNLPKIHQELLLEASRKVYQETEDEPKPDLYQPGKFPYPMYRRDPDLKAQSPVKPR
jgi:hypothetical protein